MVRRIRSAKLPLCTHSKAIDIRDQWFQIFEDMQKEYGRKLEELQKANRELEKRALKAEHRRD